jgi:hypothetical protein
VDAPARASRATRPEVRRHQRLVGGPVEDLGHLVHGDVVGRVEDRSTALVERLRVRRLVQGVGVSVDVLHLGVERRCLGGDDRSAVVLELVGDLGGVLVLAFGQLELRASEVGVVDDVGDVEEGRLVQPDVHEGRLHAREHPDHAALVDVADDALVLLTLEIELRDVAILDERHARLAAGRVDQEDAAHGGTPCARIWTRRPPDG